MVEDHVEMRTGAKPEFNVLTSRLSNFSIISSAEADNAFMIKIQRRYTMCPHMHIP